jgi:hypothetical protein
MKKSIAVIGASALLACSIMRLPLGAQPPTRQQGAKQGGQPPRSQPPRAAKPTRPPVITGPRREVGEGHIPVGAPPRPQAPAPRPGATRGGGAPERRDNLSDKPGHPDAPHVHVDNDRWIGYRGVPNDPRFRLSTPWPHGKFGGTLGARQIYRMRGGTRDRFTFDGFYFQVATYDYAFVADWLWDNDDILLYADPYDEGWYIAYNVRLGIYVHVMFLGR